MFKRSDAKTISYDKLQQLIYNAHNPESSRVYKLKGYCMNCERMILSKDLLEKDNDDKSYKCSGCKSELSENELLQDKPASEEKEVTELLVEDPEKDYIDSYSKKNIDEIEYDDMYQ